MKERGHLFVIDGDLTRIACDAWLLPTDDHFDITPAWHHVGPVNQSWQLTGHSGPTAADGTLDDSHRVIRYSGPVDGAGLYLARIGHMDADPSVYSGAAIEFLRMAEADHGADSRPLRLAINQIGSGHGGGRRVRGEVLDHLVREIERNLASGAVRSDVILVCWGEKAEAAAQHSRLVQTEDLMSSGAWHFATDNNHLHSRAQSLARHFKNRNACIFMGAGVSGGAGLPMWDDLLGQIAATSTDGAGRAEFDADDDNLVRASVLSRVLGADRFAAEITARLTSPKYSLMHGLLTSLPCEEYVTSNVDQLFEASCESKGRGVTVLPSLDEHHLIDRWLLKIHGCVSRPTTLVFTKEDYETAVSERRALFGVLQALLLTRHMVFVGYSLKDLDFRQIVDEVKAAIGETQDGRKLGTVLTLFDDPGRREQFGGLFDIIAMRPAPAPGSGPTEDEMGGAVRDLERFLDLIGMLASDRAAFLLDTRYADLLKPEERTLAEALANVVDAARGVASASGWDQVWDLLRRLGAHPERIGAERPSSLPGVPHRNLD
ncbi:MAG: SIR2 family protein [Actinomycetota bacterium]